MINRAPDPDDGPLQEVIGFWLDRHIRDPWLEAMWRKGPPYPTTENQFLYLVEGLFEKILKTFHEEFDPDESPPSGAAKATVLPSDRVPSDGEFVVYRHFSDDGTLLYVGFSERFKGRQNAHRSSSIWYPDVVRCTVELFVTFGEALEAERAAIRFENPQHNKAGKAVV
jgi:hypothetical protein